jgi:hypothetical protein
MASPANQRSSARSARTLLVRRQPGARKTTVRAHLQRAELIADRIWRRFQVGPYQWQVKHLRWYLTAQTGDYTPGTRYRHWLTVRALVVALDREEQWLSHLQGPWLRPTGKTGKLKAGRPAKLPR